MLPATRSLVDRLGQADEPTIAAMEDPAMHDDDVLRLELKRRYKMQMIKKILQDAGYEDLARMTTVTE